MLTQTALPFGGASPQARHASYLAAKAAEGRAPAQLVRYVRWLWARGEGTDLHAHRELGISRAALCARRLPLRDAEVIRPAGYWRDPDTHLRYTRWAPVPGVSVEDALRLARAACEARARVSRQRRAA